MDLLLTFSHKKVVKLLGYCVTETDQISVYEFMDSGTLTQKLTISSGMISSSFWMKEGSSHYHLMSPVLDKDEMEKYPFTLLQRVEIALGAAEGIKYLQDKLGVLGKITSQNVLLSFKSQVQYK